MAENEQEEPEIQDEPGNIFADVPMYSSNGVENWQYDFVFNIVQKGLMVGKGVNASEKIIFDPNAPITRAEFVQILYNKEGKPELEHVYAFSDVDEREWYADAVNWASINEIVSGYGNGLFGVKDYITREQVATILLGYAIDQKKEVTSDDELDNYTDAYLIDEWARYAMEWAVSNGVMAGKGEELDPLGNATRAEAATMILNYMKVYDGDE